jgi:hypothetical protein
LSLQPTYHVASGVVNTNSYYNWVATNLFLVAIGFASFTFSCKWVLNESFFQLPKIFSSYKSDCNRGGSSITSPVATQIFSCTCFLVASRVATEIFQLQVGSQLSSF